jgi:hypothetical protein
MVINMKTSKHQLFRANVPAAVFEIMLTLMLSAGSVSAEGGNTKIAPT